MKKSKQSMQTEQFSDGFTLLMVHCENGNLGEIQKLFTEWNQKKIKAELSKTNTMGNTCLSLAVKNHYYFIVKLLIQYGADINHVNNAKQPILFIPCWNSDIEMVKLLFDSGADVNYTDSRGWTPLMIASAQGSEELVEFLLQNNADVDLKDKYGKKASDKAKSHSIFYMISSAGIDKRLKKSKDHVSDYSPNLNMQDNTISSSVSKYDTEIPNVKKNLFNSTMPRSNQSRTPGRSKNTSHTPTRSSKVERDESKTKVSIKHSGKKQHKSEKRKNDILKVIHNCIKRNEDRMNIAQRTLFTNMINDEILESSTGLYEKLSRAIHTYNDKLQKELITHINLKLQIS